MAGLQVDSGGVGTRHSVAMLIDVIPLRAFRDNYIWCLQRGADAVVVDPGDATPVRKHLGSTGSRLTGILVTHHHADHTGGVAELAAEYNVPVFGPATEAIPACTHPLREGDVVALPEFDLSLAVLDVPGHTAGHIAYHGRDMLFCGDTLFSAGCGRLFEGTPAQMLASLDKLAALPPETRVYCTHEYTTSNLRFAKAADPRNPAVDARLAQTRGALEAGRPSLPSTIAVELACNPFLRAGDPGVTSVATLHSGHSLPDRLAVFTELRSWKDVF
jgi:hydroxyacylglutathione hydrolase